VRRALPAREQFQGFIKHLRRFLAEHREYGLFFAMLAAEAVESNERVADAIREKLEQYAKVLEGIIRHGQRTGEFRQDVDPLHAAHGVFGGCLGVLVHHHLFRASLGYDPLMAALHLWVVAGAQARPGG
jgi:hypothetical protein